MRSILRDVVALVVEIIRPVLFSVLLIGFYSCFLHIVALLIGVKL